jgi:hypothetical protein
LPNSPSEVRVYPVAPSRVNFEWDVPVAGRSPQWLLCLVAEALVAKNRGERKPNSPDQRVLCPEHGHLRQSPIYCDLRGLVFLAARTEWPCLFEWLKTSRFAATSGNVTKWAGLHRSCLTSCSGSSSKTRQIKFWGPILRTSARMRVGFTWRWCWTCTQGLW